MFAIIVEIIRVYGNSDRRHETIAPFLPVRMRTEPIMDRDLSAHSLPFLECWLVRDSPGPEPNA